MNKDISDALEQMYVKLRGISDEIEAISTQYKLSDIETDALEQVQSNIRNTIQELERLSI